MSLTRFEWQTVALEVHASPAEFSELSAVKRVGNAVECYLLFDSRQAWGNLARIVIVFGLSVPA